MTLTWETRELPVGRVAVLCEQRISARPTRGGGFLSGHKAPVLVVLDTADERRLFAPDGAPMEARTVERLWPGELARF